MSIPVDLATLAQTLESFGAAYLLSTSLDGRVKAVTVQPEVVDGQLLIGAASRGTSGNIAGNDRVTLLWPPLQPKGYTLIVDAVAAPAPDGPGFVVTPQTAVLHRPAMHADGPAPPDGAGTTAGRSDGPSAPPRTVGDRSALMT